MDHIVLFPERYPNVKIIAIDCGDETRAWQCYFMPPKGSEKPVQCLTEEGFRTFTDMGLPIYSFYSIDLILSLLAIYGTSNDNA